jgi:hypothetical protein
MKTLRARVREDNVRAVVKFRGEAPEYTDGMDSMDWWDVTLKMGRRQMTVPFGMGYGHGGAEPTACDVLSCLLSDVTDESFEDWCAEFGYDTDSRRAERTYNAIKKQTKKLRQFLGDKFSDYRFETEHY